jgi:hypothetical protein
MKLGAQSMSPLESGPGLTEAGKVEPDAAPKPVITKTRTAKAAIVRKRVVVGSRSDACGSYRAVWYINKDGRRKYRCEKAG